MSCNSAPPGALFSSPQPATADTRALQQLAPLLSLHQLHAQLWVCSHGGKEQPATTQTFTNKHLLSRQTSARSGKSAARSARSSVTASRPATAGTLALPSYVNPVLWSAALQHAAATQRAGVPPLQTTNPKVSAVLDLQASVLQQIQQYRQLAPSLQTHQPQHAHPYLRPARKLPPPHAPSGSDLPDPSAVAAAGAGAAAPPVVQLLPLQQLASLNGRLAAACEQVIGDLPALQTPASTAAGDTPSGGAQTRRVQHHSRVVQLCSHRSYAGAAKTARERSPPPPTLQVHGLIPDQAAASSSTPGTCKPGGSSTQRLGAVGAAAPAQDSTQQQASDSLAYDQQQQQSVSAQVPQQQLQPPNYAAVPFKLQHLRKTTVEGQGASRSRSTSPDRGRGSSSKEAPPSTLAALQAQLPPAAVAALQAAAAVSVEQHLQRYHSQLHDAQRQLLARECATADQQQQHVGAGDAASQGAAAELTMRQLVARLAQRDVQPEVTTEAAAATSGQEAGSSHAAAVNQRVAAASTLPELLEAANEHLRLAAQGSLQLDIGRIARLHKMTKQWQQTSSADASARSSGSNTAASTARSQQGPAAVAAAGGSSSSSPLQSAREATSSGKVVVPRPIVPSVIAWPPPAAARASIVSSVVSRGSDASAAAQLAEPAEAEPSQQQQHPTPTAGEAAVQALCRRASGLGSSQHDSSAAAQVVVASSASTSSLPSTAPPAAGSSSSRASCSAVDSSSRLPPPMKASPPQLQAPSAAEVAALPMPSLPLLLDLSHEPVKVLEARLQRVWDALGVPAEQQMDMVLRYTSHAASAQFETVLEAWETAAAAVLQHQALAEHLALLQAAMAHYCSQQEETGTEEEQPVLFGLTVQQVRQVIWAYLAATRQVGIAADDLLSVTGQELCVDGCAYPPALDEGDGQHQLLQQLLLDAWRLLAGAEDGSCCGGCRV